MFISMNYNLLNRDSDYFHLFGSIEEFFNSEKETKNKKKTFIKHC